MLRSRHVITSVIPAAEERIMLGAFSLGSYTVSNHKEFSGLESCDSVILRGWPMVDL